ncbi:MAG: DinB family protein [Candidatus Sulfotelmatobacter sp.]
MKQRFSLMMCGVLMLAVAAAAQANKPKDEPRTVAQVLDGAAGSMEREFVSAAEAMPEENFNYAPTAGEFKKVRTFAQQVRHVAAVNYILGAAILGEKPPVEIGGESGPASLTAKADIVKYLKASFEYAHKAIGTINDKNMLESVKSPFGEGTMTKMGLAGIVTSHGFDHYGQMAVYLRSNGIVPPASR